MASSRDFDQFYTAHSPALLRYLLSLTGSYADAEDLCQDVFLKVYLHPDELSRLQHPDAYLRVLGRHAYVDALRRKRPETVSYEDCGWRQSGPCAEDPEKAVLRQAEIVYILGLLPTELDEKILLGLCQGNSIGEIAAPLGLSSSAVRSRICRARKRLRALVAVS